MFTLEEDTSLDRVTIMTELSVKRLLSYLETSLEKCLEPLTYNQEVTATMIKPLIEGFLESLQTNRAIYSFKIDVNLDDSTLDVVLTPSWDRHSDVNITINTAV